MGLQVVEETSMSSLSEQTTDIVSSDNQLHYAKICGDNNWGLKDVLNDSRFEELIAIGYLTKSTRLANIK